MNTIRLAAPTAVLLAVAVASFGCPSPASKKDTQAACGSAGEACCATSPSCGANLACTGGVCQSPCTTTGYFREFGLTSVPDSIAPVFLTTTTRVDVVVAGDLVTPLYNRASTFVLAGSHPYGFTPANKVLVQGADLDGDGKAELVASDGKIEVLKLDPASARYTTRVTIAGKGGQGVLLADVDGANGPDLVALDYGAVTVYLNTGSAAFGSPIAIPRNQLPNAYGGMYATGAVGDLDRDGKQDLVLFEAESSTLMVLKGKGDGTFDPGTALESVSGAARRGLVLADLDGDGDLDLLVEDQSPDAVAVFLNAGNGTFGPKTRYPVTGGARGLAVGDLDGDGKLDLAVMKLNDVGVLKGSGTGTFAAEVTYQAGVGPVGATTLADLAVADLDGDGRGELVVASAQPTPKVTVLRPLAEGGLLWCCQPAACDPHYRNCGGDGCGGSCGTCTAPAACSADYVCQCTPSCAGKTCGDDGCGGSCGTCTTGTCVAGQCSCAGRCSSCLSSCRGLSGCCCGSGCMCESDCTSVCGDPC
jgi:hypothetical protein